MNDSRALARQKTPRTWILHEYRCGLDVDIIGRACQSQTLPSLVLSLRLTSRAGHIDMLAHIDMQVISCSGSKALLVRLRSTITLCGFVL